MVNGGATHERNEDLTACCTQSGPGRPSQTCSHGLVRAVVKHPWLPGVWEVSQSDPLTELSYPVNALP